MMIEPEPPTPRKDLGSRIARIVVRTALGFLIALFLLGIVGPGAFEPLVFLGIGWIGFLARTVPRITWNWDLLGMALLCMAGVLILAHWFLHWLTGQLATWRGLAGSWRWRWTWCAAFIVGIAFLVGMAVGGIAHQTAWIASSHESWYELKGPSPIRSELSQLQWALQSVMETPTAILKKPEPNSRSSNDSSGPDRRFSKSTSACSSLTCRANSPASFFFRATRPKQSQREACYTGSKRHAISCP
jgi:hypothetical protein